MKILVDSDVLLDVGTGRQPHVQDSSRVLDWCESHPGSGFIAWHTVANVYYILTRDLVKNGQDPAQARQFIADLLDFMEVVPTGTAAVKHALSLPMADFEDGMQCAAGVVAGVDCVVTRNKGDYVHAPLTAYLPSEFLTQAPP